MDWTFVFKLAIKNEIIYEHLDITLPPAVVKMVLVNNGMSRAYLILSSDLSWSHWNHARHIKPVNAQDNGGQPCEVTDIQHYLKIPLHNAD